MHRQGVGPGVLWRLVASVEPEGGARLVVAALAVKVFQQLGSVIQRLRAKGYKIEMDDFGSGYSSLNMLSSIPIDVLKMDMAFVRNIEHNEKDIQLVELILNIGSNLKIPVVAEGVETRTQLLLLKKMGCDLVQGYYFARPLPASEFEARIIKKEMAAKK